MRRWARCVVVVVVTTTNTVVVAQCPKRCNQRGLCSKQGRCECFDGFMGADCSLRRCPSGLAWSDVATDTDTAHAEVECSNRGYCDREKGLCACDDLYEGLACDRLKCPNDCGEHGVCMSVQEAAETFDGYRLNRSMHRYTQGIAYNLWDASKIQGCVCDPGYEGYDCTRLACDLQDDPRTTGQRDESVTLYCMCAQPCNGTMTLWFHGQETASFSPSDSAAVVADRLEGLGFLSSSSANRVRYPVSIQTSGGTPSVCSSTGTTSTFTFLRDAGDLPVFWVNVDDVLSPNVEAYFETNQTIACSCIGCSGSWSLEFDGQVTPTGLLTPSASAAEVETALLTVSNLKPGDLSVHGARACPISATDSVGGSLTIRFTLPAGNQPPVRVVSSLVHKTGLKASQNVFSVTTNDGTKERVYCSNSGYCDDTGDAFTTTKNGTCYCDKDYAFDPDVGECGRPNYNTSAWVGLQRCEGYVTGGTAMEPVTIQNGRFLYVMDRLNLSTARYMPWNVYGNATAVYRGDPGAYRIALDHSPTKGIEVVHSLNTSNQSAAGAGLDMSYKRLYYIDQSIRGVRSFALENATEGVREVLSGISSTLSGLTLNCLFGERVGYVTDPGEDGVRDGQIWYFDLDVDVPTITNLTEVINAQVPLRDPEGIALDLIHRTLYWTDSGNRSLTDGKVYRCSLFGRDCVLVLDRGLVSPMGLVLDLRNYTMFICDAGAGSIVKSQMNYLLDVATSDQAFFRNQTWLDTLITEVELYGGVMARVEKPWGIVLDTSEDYIYWTDHGQPGVFRADVNASEQRPPHRYSELSEPVGLVLDNGLGPQKSLVAYPCYGHGYCGGVEAHFRCICDEGWYGNCNVSYCPTGPAWFDQPTATDTAHASVPCSNAGHCDSATGQCICRPGFEGGACERLSCPASPVDPDLPCSGHGRCLTMRQAALEARDMLGDPNPVEYGSSEFRNSSAWDADHVQHCLCYSEGYFNGTLQNYSDWTGYDCSRRACPTGTPPNYASSKIQNATSPTAGDFEVQTLECSATSGTLTLTFRGETTVPIPYDADLAFVGSALRRLTTIGSVLVDPVNNVTVNPWTICNTTSATANVTFTSELGDLPLMIPDSTRLGHSQGAGPFLTVSEGTKGTKEDMTCANQGLCNEATGECQCFDWYHSSNADHGFGLRGDCGYSGALELWQIAD